VASVHPPFGRYTEPLPEPEEGTRPLVRVFLYILAALITLSLGGVVTFFLLFHTPYLDSIKPEQPELPGETFIMENSSLLDDDIQVPPRLPTPSPPRLQQHLEPQENEVSEIIDLLRTGYIEPSAILVEQLDQDALRELVRAPDRFVRLSVQATLTPFRHGRTVMTTLREQVAYWRPATFSADAVRAFTQQWAIWKSGTTAGLIIDLRYFRDGNNYSGAAAVAGLFLPPETPLFSIQKLDSAQTVFRSERQPLEINRSFPIFILVNEFTRSAAEALAYLLSEKSVAVLVGRSTAGEGGLYTESQLKSGRFLRCATTRILLADGTDMLGRPVHPDVTIPADPAQEFDAFIQGFVRSIDYLIREPEIHKPRNEDEMEENSPVNLSEHLKETDAVIRAAADMVIAIRSQRSDLPTLIEFELNRGTEPTDPDLSDPR